MGNDVFPRQDVPFASAVVAFPILGIKFPPPKKTIFGAWIGFCKPNAQNIETCVLSKMLH